MKKIEPTDNKIDADKPSRKVPVLTLGQKALLKGLAKPGRFTLEKALAAYGYVEHIKK